MEQCGGAGHSFKIAERLSKNGLLIGIDRDKDALQSSKKRLEMYSNIKYVWGRHEEIKKHISDLGINKVDGILLDLGISSYQIDEASRGFSYTKDSKLDMRMNREEDFTAKDIINKYSKNNLEEIFFKYGEEKYSRKIAERIISERDKYEITTTYELADIIRSVVPKNTIDSFKRIFQALRIEVNGELKELENTVKDGVDILSNNGRICVMTFHSLEDRIVKNTFIELEGRCTCPKDFPKCVCNYKSFGKVITKKPLVATEEEKERNSRSKSAKLRVFEKM